MPGGEPKASKRTFDRRMLTLLHRHDFHDFSIHDHVDWRMGGGSHGFGPGGRRESWLGRLVEFSGLLLWQVAAVDGVNPFIFSDPTSEFGVSVCRGGFVG